MLSFALRCLIAFLMVWAVAPAVKAAEKTALDLLPPSTVFYAEIARPGDVVHRALDHPLARRIAQQPNYQEALAQPPMQQLQAALRLVEEQLGLKWAQALAAITSGGLYAAFDLPTQGVCVLAQADDENLAERARDAALRIIRAAGRGQPDPVAEDELRGVKVHRVGNVHMAVLGKWLLVANKRLLVAMVLENYLSESGMSLAGDSQFQSARYALDAPPTAWAYADLRLLRQVGVLRAVASRKSDNPALELLAGGILGALPDANYATVRLDLDASRLKVAAAMPCKPALAAKSREFYLGPDAAGVAPPLLEPGGTLLSLSSYRDFASLWRHAPDLFNERINARLAQAESNLTTFFAGRNFRDEILGNLEPGIQLVVVRQEFPQAGVTPAIKLPAAGIVLKMKQPEATARIFKITFQSAIGFLNVVGAMNKAPPLDLTSEKVGEALVVSSEYLPPLDPQSLDKAAIHYNASPTAVFFRERLILTTARPLALALLDQLQQSGAAASGTNTQLFVDAQSIRQALADNRQPLIAQNMLDKGHDRAAAEKEIDSLLGLLAFLQRATLQLEVEEQRLILTVDLTLSDPK